MDLVAKRTSHDPCSYRLLCARLRSRSIPGRHGPRARNFEALTLCSGGALIYQNPDAVHTFGQANAGATDVFTCESKSDAPHSSECDVLSRFVDKSLGRTALQKVSGH
jgi:hypothetical protein